jgi:o-succinylbenzoate synthase
MSVNVKSGTGCQALGSKSSETTTRNYRWVHIFAIPLRTHFRGITVREGVLIEGPAGWAEFSPFWDYDTVEAATWWRAAQEAATTPWPTPVRTEIPVNVTVPVVSPEEAAALVRSSGCATAKVKVADPSSDDGTDIARLEAVREALGATGRIRIDANGAWDIDTALRLITSYDAAAGGLEYVEQPCATVEELAAVRRRVQVPIAADEAIRRAEDPMRVARLDAADVAVLKVQPLGGVRAALRVAEGVGMPVVVSSALETSIGIAAGVALAAALPELPYACGLGTVALLARDVVAEPLLPVDGVIPVRRPPLDPERLGESVADDEISRRWHERIRAVEALS